MKRIVRVGRMSRWQRWSSFVVLGTCLLTGVVYAVRQDLFDLPPSANRFWWIAHGVASLIGLVAIGAALSQHVPVAWRAGRGRATGTVNLVFLIVLTATTLVLFYGLEDWHAGAHWVHVVAGVLAVIAFPGHILWGRTRAARLRSFQ